MTPEIELDVMPDEDLTLEVASDQEDVPVESVEVVRTGGGGTSDYNDLSNKPQIAGTTLSGNKSLSDLGAEPEALKVTITNSGGSYSSDKTYSEISAAITAQKRVYAVIGNDVFSYYGKQSGSNSFLFSSQLGALHTVITIASENTAVSVQTSYSGSYSKPVTGIPKSDLSSGVQTSLDKADSALQSYTETDPTVPSWAKASSKPSYTASEVGAIAAPVSPSSGDVLTYSGSAWTAAAPTAVDPAEVTVSTAGAVTQALDAGKIYHFTGALTSLTITLNATTGLAHYHFDFDCGSTAPSVTIPNTVTMPSGNSFDANKHYEVDILNNYGAVISWANS